MCDAIKPAMTHLAPLACAFVERRGGMPIHGAIIARELGIPRVDDTWRSSWQVATSKRKRCVAGTQPTTSPPWRLG